MLLLRISSGPQSYVRARQLNTWSSSYIVSNNSFSSLLTIFPWTRFLGPWWNKKRELYSRDYSKTFFFWPYFCSIILYRFLLLGFFFHREKMIRANKYWTISPDVIFNFVSKEDYWRKNCQAFFDCRLLNIFEGKFEPISNRSYHAQCYLVHILLALKFIK